MDPGIAAVPLSWRWVSLLALGLCFQGSVYAVFFHLLGSERLFLTACALGWTGGVAVLVRNVFFSASRRDNVLAASADDLRVWLWAGVGLLLGVAAILAMPFAFDSAELGQMAVLARSGVESSAASRGMASYQGALMPMVLVFSDWPVPVIGAGFKLLIASLGLCATDLTGRAVVTEPRFRHYCVAGAALLSSTLINFGMIVLGKDSIVGILLFWLVVMAQTPQLQSLPRASRPDLATAAFSTGVITLPYLFLFFLLQICVDRGLGQVVATYARILLPAAFVLPYALELQLGISLLPLSALFIVAYAIWIAADWTLGLATVSLPQFLNRGLVLILRLAPVLAIVGLMLAFPLTAALDPEFNYQWSTLRAPLGDVSFWASLYGDTHLERNLSPALLTLAGLCICLGALVTRSGFTLIVFNFPVLVLAFCCAHVFFEWQLLRYRLLWDLYKDIPQWLAGPLVAYALLWCLELVASQQRPTRLLALVLTIWAIGAPDSQSPMTVLHQLGASYTDERQVERKELLVSVANFSVRVPELHTVYFARGLSTGARSLHAALGYQAVRGSGAEAGRDLETYPIGAVILVCDRRRRATILPGVTENAELSFASGRVYCAGYRRF